jgi:predicted hydrocarbon binding protein
MTDLKDNQQVFYIPNKIGRILLLSYEEVIGQAAIIAAEKMAGLHHLVGNLPPNNIAHEFVLNDLSSFQETLEKMYGPHAGRGIAVKAGRVFFKYSLREFGPVLGISRLTYRLSPLSKKIEKGMKTLTDIFNRYSHQNADFRVEPDFYVWELTHCPICWNRKTDSACCHLSVGLFQEFLFWVSGGKHYQVEEISCIAAGDNSCGFHISRNPLE